MSIDTPDIPEEASSARLIANLTAKSIGFDDVTEDRILSIIDESNSGQHIFHGVKRRSLISSVDSHGVLPLTPEGGFISCWTSGSEIFGHLEGPERKVSLYGSTFSDYGHSFPEFDQIQNLSDEEMCIAITNGGLMEKHVGRKGQISHNETAHLNFPIPRQAMCLLRVKLIRKEAGRPSCLNRRILERQMIKLMEKTLSQGYQGGETMFTQIREEDFEF